MAGTSFAADCFRDSCGVPFSRRGRLFISIQLYRRSERGGLYRRIKLDVLSDSLDNRLVVVLFDSATYVFLKVSPSDYRHFVSTYLHQFLPKRSWLEFEHYSIQGVVMIMGGLKNLMQIVIANLVFSKFLPFWSSISHACQVGLPCPNPRNRFILIDARFARPLDELQTWRCPFESKHCGLVEHDYVLCSLRATAFYLIPSYMGYRALSGGRVWVRQVATDRQITIQKSTTRLQACW